MEKYKLQDFTRGWFVGDFSPALKETKDCEVAVKLYKKGDCERAHYHKVAEEITVIIEGRCRFNERVFEKGDIVLLSPGEVVEFEALENSTTVVVKIPSVKGDKYLA